jgi:hypothetical protein
MTLGDRQAVEDFKAYLAARARERDAVELPDDDDGTTGICWCGREKQPGENHSLCYPGME